MSPGAEERGGPGFISGQLPPGRDVGHTSSQDVQRSMAQGQAWLSPLNRCNGGRVGSWIRHYVVDYRAFPPLSWVSRTTTPINARYYCPTNEGAEALRLTRLRARWGGGGIRTHVPTTPEAPPLTAYFHGQQPPGAWAPDLPPGPRRVPLGAPPRRPLPSRASPLLPQPRLPAPPARSPAALPRAPPPGGCGGPGSGRRAPRRQRTRAVARSSRTSSEPGCARGTAARTAAPRSPQTWPSAPRRALHLPQVTAGRGLRDPAPGPRQAAGRAGHPGFLPACPRRRRVGARWDSRAGSPASASSVIFLLN